MKSYTWCQPQDAFDLLLIATGMIPKEVKLLHGAHPGQDEIWTYACSREAFACSAISGYKLIKAGAWSCPDSSSLGFWICNLRSKRNTWDAEQPWHQDFCSEASEKALLDREVSRNLFILRRSECESCLDFLLSSSWQVLSCLWFICVSIKLKP